MAIFGTLSSNVQIGLRELTLSYPTEGTETVDGLRNPSSDWSWTLNGAKTQSVIAFAP